MSTRPPRSRGWKRMRPRTRVFAVRACAMPLAIALGLGAAINPGLSIVVVAALAAVGVCLPRGHLAVAAFAAATFFEVVGTSVMSPVKMLGGVVVLASILLLLAPTRGRSPRAAAIWPHHPFTIVFALSLVTWGIASVSWATDTSQVRLNGIRLAMDVLVLFAIPVLVRHARDIRLVGWWIALAAILGAGAGRALGHEFGGRATGMFSDPNEFATATVVGAAFAVALGESSESRLAVWLGRAIACLSLIAVVTSASRSGVVAAVLALLVLIVTARGVERVRLAGLASLAVAAATVWLMLSPGGAAVLERLGGENSTGRADLWRVARYQFEDEPVHGVGLGNYPVVSIQYLRGDVANIDLFIRMPRTVHNTPLELLAELGVVGFVSFYGMVIGCMLALHRALKLGRTLNDAGLIGAIRGTAAGVAALLAASLTLSGLYVELQWILFGVCLASTSIVRGRLITAKTEAAELDPALFNRDLEAA